MSEAMSVEQLQALITVGQVAELFEVPARVVRAAARKDEIPGLVKVLGKFGFDPEAVTGWIPPEAGTRRVGVRREDGRKRYRIYLTNEELELLAATYEIADPSVAAKERRAARRAAKAEAKENGAPETASDDPFADFG